MKETEYEESPDGSDADSDGDCFGGVWHQRLQAGQGRDSKLAPKKEFNTFDLSTNEGFLQRIQKQLDDFRECGIDPMFGLAEPGHDAAEGYICIENKGWYNAAGPTCTRWLLFDKPACVEWRK